MFYQPDFVNSTNPELQKPLLTDSRKGRFSEPGGTETGQEHVQVICWRWFAHHADEVVSIEVATPPAELPVRAC